MATPSAPAPVDARALRWDMEEDGFTLLPIVWRHPLEWRDAADEPEKIEIWVDKGKRWRRVRRANWLPFLQGLAAGLTLPEVYRQAKPHFPDRVDPVIRFTFGRILGSLRRWDLMDFVLPEVPPVLGDRYRIKRELGRGGTGIVWLATDERTGAGPLAVKHAWNGSGVLGSRDRAIREEYTLMQTFDHPGIVKALDGFEHDGRFHLVRPCLDGTPLSKVGRERRSDPAFRAAVTRQIAETMVHMIEAGYFYLDLKPSNYFVDEHDRVMLSDLGMCKRFNPETRAVKGVIATYAYAAPELYRKAEVTEPTLVYALAASHWQLVDGHSPKPKVHPDRLLARLPADLPEWERDFLTAALRPDPQDRPQTVREAAALLPTGGAA